MKSYHRFNAVHLHLVKFSLQLSVSGGGGVNQFPASLGLLVSILLDLLCEQVLIKTNK